MPEPLPEPDPSLHWVGDEDPRRGRRQFEMMLEWGLDPTQDLLEIGCGTGRLAYQLADYFERGSYAGFDIAPKPIEWLRQEYSTRRANFRFDLVEVDNDRYRPDAPQAAQSVVFPYDDGQFDFVCAHAVFVHMQLPAIERYLCESYRVLRPGGRLLATLMVIIDEDEPGVFSGREFVRMAEGTYTRYPDRVGFSMAYTWDLILGVVKGAGFDLLATVDGRWHAPFQKREGKVPGADLIVATRPARPPLVKRRRWRVWRQPRS